MAELKITFKGICGHYTGVVPGVPHRIVMPDASGVHFGTVRCPGENAGMPLAYCLLPHRVMWWTGPDENPYQWDDALAPSRLRIVNAVTDRKLEYESCYETVPRISDYVPRFKYSRDVVLGGHAALYFDVFGGRVRAHTDKNGMVTVEITMETDGPAVLGVTPFALNGHPDEDGVYKNIGEPEQQIPLESTELTVANSDIDTRDEDKTLDFLLHYLAAESGIPALLEKATPGLGDHAKSQTSVDMATALRGLACVIERHGPGGAGSTGEAGGGARPRVMNASCSDSRYP